MDYKVRDQVFKIREVQIKSQSKWAGVGLGEQS